MHPSARILLLLILALMVYGLEPMALQLYFVAMIMALLVYDLMHLKTIGDTPEIERFRGMREFFRLLRRVRYILLVLMLVYAYNTPGEYLPAWYFSLTPTYEGLQAGVVQALRVVLIIAGMACLLTTTDRDQMIAGLYWLARPFKLPAFHPDRFAVRLWLTLHYVEHRQSSASPVTLRQLLQLEHMLQIDDTAPEQIVLQSPAIRTWDIVVVAGVAVLGVYNLCG